METIRIEDGEIWHLQYHNYRLNRSRRELFEALDEIDLTDYIKSIPPVGLWRCRVLYTSRINRVEYYPYTTKIPKSFTLLEFKEEYSYKYANRSILDRVKLKYPTSDDILLYNKDGYLTDTTIANIALRSENRWFTPAKPLLEGTTRKRLLDIGFLDTKDIHYSSLEDFDELALMNAMIGFLSISKVKIISSKGIRYVF